MKKGISLVSVAVIVVVLVILAGIVVTAGIDSFGATKLNTFALEVLNIQTGVNEYKYRYEKYPTTGDITLDVSTMDTNSLTQFNGENIVNNIISLKVVSLSAIGINETEFGNNENIYDVYALSETTGKVYYLSGVEYEGNKYYTLTEALYDMANITNVPNNDMVSPQDIKIYDVIFSVSNTNYTNNPITVEVKIPQGATFNTVTTTKSVSEAVVSNGYNVISINETSADKNGNYDIEVGYTFNGIKKTARYSVANFDNTAPVLTTSVSESGNNKTITITTTDNLSGIKIVKYDEKEIEDYTYFKNYGKELKGSEFVVTTDGAYTIYVEDNAGNHSEVVNIGYATVPGAWRNNVIDIYNTVPIPKGFVVSQATGENRKQAGLVIYEGTDSVTNENVDKARRERNQYVWVPVNNFVTEFVRKDYINTPSIVVDTLGTPDKYWQVLPTTELNDTNLMYMTEKTLSEVQAMYASVKEYGGFYIARYEVGIDAQRTAKGTAEELPGIKAGTKVYSVMGKIPYTYIPWTWNNAMNEDANGAVEVARNMYRENSTNYGAVSTLTYGVQWDRVIQWYIDTGVMTLDQVNKTEGSTEFGNYSNHVIAAGDLNTGAKYAVYSSSLRSYQDVAYGTDGSSTSTKANGTSWALSTGALKAANLNNIYDMAGNMYEWTMDGRNANRRCFRGGVYNLPGTDYPVAGRFNNDPNYTSSNYSFRPSLYIKIK